MNQMIVQRMSNPLWLVPKGAEIQKFTGEPGLVVQWNPLTVGGDAKPERIEGASIPSSIFDLRNQKLKDLEEALGTYDVLKGNRPPNVSAFSSMQLLVERAQSRFSASFKARGRLYGSWLKFALEIERQFGDAERREPMLSPAGTWVERVFKNTDLQGAFTVMVEDGSMTPKTTLGMRAAVEHINTLGGLDMADPDQRYTVLQLFGQTKLAPTLNVHMQAALRKQQAFEEWALYPPAQTVSQQQMQLEVQRYAQEVEAVQSAPPQLDPVTGQDIAPQPVLPPPPSPTKFTPLDWKPWYDPIIHRQEFLKWVNSGRIVELLSKNPSLELLLAAHLQDIEAALAEKQARLAQAAGPAPGGAGVAMRNSNAESGGSQNASDHTRRPQEGV